jgi:hypothetical protein
MVNLIRRLECYRRNFLSIQQTSTLSRKAHPFPDGYYGQSFKTIEALRTSLRYERYE